MKRIIIFTFLFMFAILPFALSLPDKIFILDITIFKNDTASLNNFKIVEGVPDSIQPGQYNEDYLLRIVSQSNEILFERNLPAFFVSFPDEEIAPGSPSGTIEHDSTPLFLKLPYFSEANKIEIYHIDKLIFQYEILKNQETVCGNGICEFDENFSTCPQDCPKPAVCGNNICETNETSDNCCKDCVCPEGKKCLQNKCIPDVCGNSFCESKFGENYNTCKGDCPSGSKDNYCDGLADGICDPDCSKEEDIDCEKPNDSSFIYMIIVGIFVVLIILVIVRSRRAD